MSRGMLTAFVLLAVAGPWAIDGAGVKAGTSPVQKVLQLIDEFTAKVKGEFEAATKTFDEFAVYCDDEATEKSHAVKNSKKQIEQMSASIVDAKAGIEVETSTVADASSTISGTEAELSKAIALRESEHSDFVAVEKELLGTIDSLAGAQEMLKKSLGLLQENGAALSVEDQNALNDLASSLGQIAEAAYVTTEQRQTIEALFQSKEDTDEDLTFRTRSRSAGGGSDAIIDTLSEMEDKASDTLTKTRNEEGEAATAHALLKQGLENEIKGLKQELAEAARKKQGLIELLATTEKDLAVEKTGLSESEAYTRELKRDCQGKAKEYEVMSKDTDEELAALSKAKAILAKKFGAALVQTGSRTRTTSGTRFGDDARATALRMIEALGKKYHSTALVSLAYRAAADPFKKIRGMIEDMIAKLMQEAAEGASQKAFCDKELGESTASREAMEASLEKLGSRLGEAEARVSTLTEEVAQLSQELADNDKAMAHATAIRDEEKAAFAATEKELSESEEACSAAISVLREYYEGASFVQVSSTSKLRSSAAAGAEGGGGIIAVLEVAESDFASSLAEARAAEASAVDEYNKVMQDAKLLKATKSMEVKGKESEIKSVKVTISDSAEDKAGVSEELDAVLAYLDKLKPQCETKEPSYAEIKAKREAEIEGLKEALQTLAGDAPAFLQTSASKRGLRGRA